MEVPKAPFEYILIKYCQAMHMSYMDALAMPAYIVLQHMKMLDIEAEMLG